MENSVGDVDQFLRSDIAFHLAVAQASHNNILMNALLLIRNLLQNWIGSTLRIQGVAERALQQHQRIFLVIAKKNPPAARSAMQSRLQEMANFLLASQKAEGKNAGSEPEPHAGPEEQNAHVAGTRKAEKPPAVRQGI